MVTYDTALAQLPGIAIAVPIIVAAVLLAVGRFLPRPAIDGLALAGATAVVGLVSVVLARTAGGRVVSWAAHWEPKRGFSVGIVLVADPVNAGVALLAGCLVVLSLVYSWRYFESVEAHYHCLVMVFLSGMVGFALTGDLFDMFVFFEVMGAAAYALTGFKVEDATAVQGALNFGIINSLGAYAALMGVGLLYARVGNLTLPQVGEALAGHAPDALVVAAFVAIMTGFLVKAAMVPFHFWLADAHAVAPTPICVLFSGVMVPLGVYAAFRVYWTGFSRALPIGDVRRTFVVLGAVTAVVGAVMCFAQRHFKRLLAFSTVAHVGLFLVAAGCLTTAGTAGAALYVVAHAGVKCALFLTAGVLLNRYGSVDEFDLHGRGRELRLLPWVCVVAGLALAGLPPFGTGLGKAVSEDAGVVAGYPWVPVLFVVTSALTGGAVLRASGRIWFGLGAAPRRGGTAPEDTAPEDTAPEDTAPEDTAPEDMSGSREEPETRTPLTRIRLTMLVPIVVLLLGALLPGVLPGAHTAAEHAAAFFTDGAGYAREALTGRAVPHLVPPPEAGWTVSGVLLGLLSGALAVGLAALALHADRIPARGLGRRAGQPVVDALRRLHSGHLGDYVAWVFTGMAALGAFVGLPLL